MPLPSAPFLIFNLLVYWAPSTSLHQPRGDARYKSWGPSPFPPTVLQLPWIPSIYQLPPFKGIIPPSLAGSPPLHLSINLTTLNPTWPVHFHVYTPAPFPHFNKQKHIVDQPLLNIPARSPSQKYYSNCF